MIETRTQWPTDRLPGKPRRGSLTIHVRSGTIRLVTLCGWSMVIGCSRSLRRRVASEALATETQTPVLPDKVFKASGSLNGL